MSKNRLINQLSKLKLVLHRVNNKKQISFIFRIDTNSAKKKLCRLLNTEKPKKNTTATKSNRSTTQTINISSFEEEVAFNSLTLISMKYVISSWKNWNMESTKLCWEDSSQGTDQPIRSEFLCLYSKFAKCQNPKKFWKFSPVRFALIRFCFEAKVSAVVQPPVFDSLWLLQHSKFKHIYRVNN